MTAQEPRIAAGYDAYIRAVRDNIHGYELITAILKAADGVKGNDRRVDLRNTLDRPNADCPHCAGCAITGDRHPW